MSQIYKEFVSLLREIYPSLSLSFIVNDTEEAVRNFGIKVKYSNMSHIRSNKTISSYSIVVDGKPEIVVNGLLNLQSQRFTIAHELGHILIHWQWRPDIDLDIDLREVTYRNELYKDNIDSRDRQANLFAEEFLAPQKEVIKRLKQIETTDREYQISFIEKEFNISKVLGYIIWKKIINKI